MAKRRITQTTPRDSSGTIVFCRRQQSLVGDAPIPLITPEICTHSDQAPFEHNDFDQYPLIVPQPWELAKNVQLALIRNRPRAFQRAVYEPCMLPLIPAKGGTKRDYAVLPVKFNICRKKSAAKFRRVKTRGVLLSNGS